MVLTLVAALRTDAQSSSMSVTIARGPHAGKYEMTRGQCDALDGQIISMFTPRMAGMSAGPKTPESMELYTEPAAGKAAGFAVNVDFRAPTGERVVYEIYAIPPELQGPGRNKPPKGRGSVTIEQRAEGTHARFRGQTKDGIGMEGSVTCVKRK
jgi:hypothetical protein